MATVNMGLTEPTPSVTPGPTWAQQLVTDLDLLDAHDHSASKGARIGVPGLNIQADLPINGKKITQAGGLTLQAGGVLVNLTAYTNGTDLFFQDGTGAACQITQGGDLRRKGFTSSDSLSIGPTTFNSRLSLAAGSIRTITGNTTLSAAGSEVFILCDVSGGTFTVTLPAVSTAIGRVFIFKEKTGSATNITFARDAATSDRFDNVNTATVVKSGANATYRLVADINIGWWFI